MSAPFEKLSLEQVLRKRDRGILTEAEVVGQINFLIGPGRLESFIAEIPLSLIEPVKARAYSHPGKYHRLHDSPSESVWRCLAEAGRVTLFPILPSFRSEVEGSADYFRGHQILRQLDVSDPRGIEEIASALRAGSDQGTRGNRCFIPHHGIRVGGAAGALDMVICFECENMQYFSSLENSLEWCDMSEKPRPLLDRLLVEAGIPLSPLDLT